MERVSCSLEVEVSKAVRSGGLDAPLAAHAAECAVCRGIVEASEFMAALGGRASENPVALPDAGLLYWRARLSEDVARAEKARELLDWVETAPVAIATGAAAWAAWHWLTIQGLIALFVLGARFGGASISTPIIVLAMAGILGLLAAIVAYPGLVDE